MGNAAASCAPSIICSSTGVVKALFSDGKIEIYTRPVRAGELMLRNPGHFVCNSSHLKVGHRVAGLMAEEELRQERRHGQRRMYYLLPMEMLYSVLTNEELGCLNDRACKALKQQGAGGTGYLISFPKMFPAGFGEFCLFSSGHSDHSESKTTLYSESVAATAAADSGHSRQRSWIPALETIVETPPRRCLRRRTCSQ